MSRDATPADRAPPEARRRRGRALLLGGALILSLALCAIAIATGWASPSRLRALAEGGGPYGPPTFLLAMFVAELLWLPRIWGLLAAGALFGPLHGALLAAAADLACALVCYLAARTALRPYVAEAIARRLKLARWVALLAEERGHLTILALRVGPVHFTALSYAAGVAGVRPAPYLVGTLLGMLPGGILYPLMGHAAHQPSRLVLLGLLGLALLLTALAFVTSRRVAAGATRASQPERHLVGEPEPAACGRDPIGLDP